MLQATALTKQYGAYTALHGLDLTVNKGEIFCMLGQNGAGKTTTVNIFLGFTAATSGTAAINGKVVSTADPITRKYTAYIPEVVMLYSHFTGLENLDFFSRLAGNAYKRGMLEQYLSQAGLQPSAFHQRVGTYSKGMRQKVGIAIALAKHADVVFMDEPTSGLDPKATSEFTDIVKALGEQGKSVFIATHDIFNAVNLATTIGIMKEGRLVHTLQVSDIDAAELQKIYLEMI
ncbi:ABC transporter ATP-binding protein [Chitinophaga filiformis]|uniref:ABC transporter ATP-binding protein n=1 Tax=Chitinophaga filiformis TaxID=104663 RepID=UPI001F22B51A|nr:ABC transporter ATP-binding protein [Chitinophaga filiformis]MCF6407054.1 ABC transporter ATP-binding protein [Chitinophaga filiformis]